MERVKTLLTGIVFMMAISFFWLSSIWTRFGFSDPITTTEYILQDLQWLGPAAFIFDILFFYFIYRIILPKKEKALLTNLSTTPLLMIPSRRMIL